MHKIKPLIRVILINYNGHHDTVQCVNSLLNSDYDNFSIVIVDNSNNNSSVDYITKWADGNIDFNYDGHPIENNIIARPLKYIVIQESQIDEFNNEQLIILKANENKGFAAANNLAIRYLNDNYDWLWILNNDTVVERNCLTEFVRYLKGYNTLEGIIGTNLYYYHNPSKLQGIAGTYNKWFGISSHLSVTVDKCDARQKSFKDKADFIMGASMFVSQKFVYNVGPMDERYFLYFEEIDWALRGKAKNYKLGYACHCDVYHKEGASIGSTMDRNKSKLAEFYSLKNKIIFTKKFYPFLLPFIYFSLAMSFILRLYRRQFSRAHLVIDIIRNK